tara:strand:- start:336 stop:542 length:207 start_codon:yes stop_codon:yes gene_type:complete
MSHPINDMILENISEEVCEMAEKDIWNVIFAIEKEFGIENLPNLVPSEDGEEAFISKLIDLRFESMCP